MSSKIYKVYFNAVSAEHGNHLFAVGWTTTTGLQPILEKDKSGDFIFDIKKTDDVSTQVITPFQLSVEIPDNLRSIFVKVAGENHQVQVNELKGGEGGSNTSGTWVEIKVSE